MIDGKVSAARALWLLEQLGEGSAIGAAIAGGPEYRAWTTATTLAAYSLNALNGANWQRGGGRKSRPKPIEPPQPKNRGRKKAGSSLQRRIAQQAALRRAQAEAVNDGTSDATSTVERGGLGVRPATTGGSHDGTSQ